MSLVIVVFLRQPFFFAAIPRLRVHGHSYTRSPCNSFDLRWKVLRAMMNHIFSWGDFVGVAGKSVFALGGVYLGDDVHGADGGNGTFGALYLYGSEVFPRWGGVGSCLAASAR